MPTINFDLETVANGFVDIDDLSNFALKATTENLCDYYMVVKTSMGVSSILTFGPLEEDFNFLGNEVFYSFKKIEYNDKQLEKLVSLFLNGKIQKKYAETMSIDAALNKCVDLGEYMKREER